MTALAAAAVWLQPVLLATLALRVAGGDADAPWLALGALVAPLVALVAAPRRASGSNPVVATATAAAVTLVLAADFIVAADAATLLGAAPWLGVTLAAALSLLVPLLPGARRVSAPALAVATGALLLPLVSVALTTGTAPWTAWSRGGWRPSLTFPETSGWVRDGERFARPARLTFAEAQRVTTLTAGVYRVVERDAAEPTVREWRLAAGETLTLRPGDELSVEAGARLRFEAGRRVPGAPASGIVWADAPARGPSMLPAAVGALATLVGGALALVPAPRRGPPAAAGPLVLLTATAAAVGWGVYAAATAPDLALGGSLLAPIVTLPLRALGPRTGAPLAVLALAAFVALLLTAVVALRARLADAAGPAPTRWAVAVGLAAALTAAPLDPWRVLALGLGVAAAAGTPSLVASGRAGGLAGSSVGAAAFVALAALPSVDPAMGSWLEPLARYPALVAMPLGWVAAWALSAMTGGGDATQPIVR
jgi:hypothetical protein